MVAIGVPAESQDEPRIGLTPETVKKLVKAGASVKLRSGAGLRSHFSDDDYKAAGAKIAASRRRMRSRTPTSCSPCGGRARTSPAR